MTKKTSTKGEALRVSGGLRADWRDAASCRGYASAYGDPWDADPKDGSVNPTARSFCDRCPVKRECLIEGLRSDRLNGGDAFGIWGGLSPRQRRALVRARQRQGCPICYSPLLITSEQEDWQACAACAITWRTTRKRPRE